MRQKLLDLEKQMQTVLKESRFIHSQGVRYTAAALAMRYGEDMLYAQIAGILHDCAKGYSEDELLNFCREKNIEVSVSELAAPYLLHAKAGAYLAKEKYGVETKEILSAIRYHTTGRAGMTELEQIIFIADYIEPNRRKIPGLEKSRQLAFSNLDLATCYILENTLAYLREIKGEDRIDETTKEAYCYYQEKCKKEKRLCQQN